MSVCECDGAGHLEVFGRCKTKWRKDCFCNGVRGRSGAFGWEINNNHRARVSFWHIVYYWFAFLIVTGFLSSLCPFTAIRIGK